MIDMVELERDRMVLEKIDIDRMSYDDLEKELGISKADLCDIRRKALERLEKKAREALTDSDALDAVRCIQYVLDIFGIHKSLEVLESLAVARGWLAGNVMELNNLDKIPQYYGLETKAKKRTLATIANSLRQDRQILAVVDGGEIVGDPRKERYEDTVAEIPDHVVVVLHIDIEDDEVILYDPAFGDIPLTVTTAHFLDAWHDSGNLAVEIFENTKTQLYDKKGERNN